MNYIIEANLGIVFLFGIYFLLLRNETEFRKQRVFLLGGLLCALVFPLIQMPVSYEVERGLAAVVLPELAIGQSSSNASSFDVVLLLYTLIAVSVAVPLVVHGLKLYHETKKLNGKYHGDYYVIESEHNRPSWSFFRLIYIGRSTELSVEEKQLILKHEMWHGRLYHSIDMLFVTLLCIVFWFNPVVWMYRRTLAKVHEFEVDALVADQNGAVDYGMLLAKTALSGNGLVLTHHFNQSFILKRINMINMIKNRISNWKFMVLGIAVALYITAVACTEQVSENDPQEKGEKAFSMVEQTAVPPMGMTKYYEQLSSALVYPEVAMKQGIEGKVFVEFLVNIDGTLSDFKVLKGISKECDEAAMRAIGQVGNWTPAKQKGKEVIQRMVLPITFKLN
jgi:TonB family protein